MRTTINIKHTSGSDFAKTLRSLAAKVEASEVVPGADLKVGNARVQVATPKIGDIRQWAVENGYQIGGRGVIANSIKEAYAAAKREANAAKRAAARERKAQREAEALVTA